jgi:hypothetical protein
MKKYTFLFIAILATTFFFTSCKKERTGEVENISLNVTINAGEIYKLDLSKYADAYDVITLSRQALEFSISEIVKVSTLDEYQFLKAGNPKVGGNGTEMVQLNVREKTYSNRCGNGNAQGNNGDHHRRKQHKKEKNITINFTIL